MPADKQFEPIRQAGLSRLTLRKGGNLNRIINDKSRLNQLIFNKCVKCLRENLTPDSSLISKLHPESFCLFACFFVGIKRHEIHTCILFYSVIHGKPRKRRCQVNIHSLIVDLCCPVDFTAAV